MVIISLKVVAVKPIYALTSIPKSKNNTRSYSKFIIKTSILLIIIKKVIIVQEHMVRINSRFKM